MFLHERFLVGAFRGDRREGEVPAEEAEKSSWQYPSGAIVDVERVEQLTYVAAAGALGEGRRALGPRGRWALGASSRWSPRVTAATSAAAAAALDAQRRFGFSAATATATTATLQMHVRYAEE